MTAPLTVGRCEHGSTPCLCRRCHSEVCVWNLPHDGHCDEGDHEGCSGYTDPLDTYRCDCICHCPYR